MLHETEKKSFLKDTQMLRKPYSTVVYKTKNTAT